MTDDGNSRNGPAANPQVDKLHKSITALKGHLTRNMKELDRSVKFLHDTPHEMQDADVMAKMDKVDTLADKIAAAYEALMDVNPTSLDSYVTKWDQLKEEIAAAKHTAVQAIIASKTTAAQPIRQAPQAGQAQARDSSVRVQTALQPEKLQKDATPAALRSWSRKFKSFFQRLFP